MGSAGVSEQKVVIITGGSFGIGSWLAEHLHKGGYKVAICGRREKEGIAKAAALDPTGESVIFIQADVGSYQSQANLFQAVWKKWSRIDVLIANAGFIDQGSVYNFRNRNASVDDLPPEPNLSVTEVNWKGTIYGTVLAIHFMRHNPTKGGKIIATGSTLGIYSTATFPEYCGTKAAINVFVRTVGPILKIKENIKINAVVAGPIETDAMPGFSVAFLPEQLVLKDNLISAYDRFLESDETGSTVEVAHDTLIDWGKPEFKSGAFAERSEKVYEPWFAWIHGEISELPDALTAPPERAQA